MTHPLRSYRHANGITLQQLACEAGVTKSYLSKVESHSALPSLAVVERLVIATNGAVSANDFMPPTGPRDPGDSPSGGAPNSSPGSSPEGTGSEAAK